MLFRSLRLQLVIALLLAKREEVGLSKKDDEIRTRIIKEQTIGCLVGNIQNKAAKFVPCLDDDEQ